MARLMPGSSGVVAWGMAGGVCCRVHGSGNFAGAVADETGFEKGLVTFDDVLLGGVSPSGTVVGVDARLLGGVVSDLPWTDVLDSDLVEDVVSEAGRGLFKRRRAISITSSGMSSPIVLSVGGG